MSRSHIERRLHIEIAPGDLLADLVDGLLHTLTGGDDDVARGITAIGCGQLNADVDQGWECGAGEDAAPMSVQ